MILFYNIAFLGKKKGESSGPADKGGEKFLVFCFTAVVKEFFNIKCFFFF